MSTPSRPYPRSSCTGDVQRHRVRAVFIGGNGLLAGRSRQRRSSGTPFVPSVERGAGALAAAFSSVVCDCVVEAFPSSAMAVALTPATPPSIATAATIATNRLVFFRPPRSYRCEPFCNSLHNLACLLRSRTPKPGVTLIRRYGIKQKHECVHPGRGNFYPTLKRTLEIFSAAPSSSTLR